LWTWLIPVLYSALAIAAGLSFPRLEQHFLPRLLSSISVPAAMAIYSSIASGMIALTGIVFSLAFVMVQFSATAYSPRLVLWVARDPVMSHALGVFTATFLYALAALAWIDRGGSGKVPLISVWVSVALVFASVAMFIALIREIGLLQINQMLIFTGNQGRGIIKSMYPSIEATGTNSSYEFRRLPRTQTLRHNGPPRIIQAVDVNALVDLAKASGGVIEMVAAVGDTAMELTPILHVFGARRAVDERALSKAIEVGGERTFEQDPKYAIRLLVDIAIKALSPAVNDPTTAVQALDQIEDLLLRLGLCRLEIGAFRDGDGELRLILPFPAWEDFLRLGLDEIRFCGAGSIQVMRRMNAVVSELISVLPEERHAALKCWEQRLHATIGKSFTDPEDRREALVEDRQGLGIPRRSSPTAAAEHTTMPLNENQIRRAIQPDS